MSTDAGFIEFVMDQIECPDRARYRKMFGEYALYFDDKVVALVCDNQCFVKPTTAGKAFIGEVTEGFPYPGAKAAFLIDGRLEDREWFTELLRITARELPAAKPKKKKS